MIHEEVVRQLKEQFKWSEEAVRFTARLGERAGYRCEYCGLDLVASPEAYKLWEIDHIIPSCCGGDDLGFANLALACRPCNWSFKRGWDPRTKAGPNANRDQLIEAAKSHIAEQKCRTEEELKLLRGLTHA